MQSKMLLHGLFVFILYVEMLSVQFFFNLLWYNFI